MASLSETKLLAAGDAVESALARLEAAVEIAMANGLMNAEMRESVQAEISNSWQQQCTSLESSVAELNEENTYLKDENQRLSNQLQSLQQEFLSLQKVAGKAASKLDASVKQLDMMLEA